MIFFAQRIGRLFYVIRYQVFTAALLFCEFWLGLIYRFSPIAARGMLRRFFQLFIGMPAEQSKNAINKPILCVFRLFSRLLR